MTVEMVVPPETVLKDWTGSMAALDDVVDAKTTVVSKVDRLLLLVVVPERVTIDTYTALVVVDPLMTVTSELVDSDVVGTLVVAVGGAVTGVTVVVTKVDPSQYVNAVWLVVVTDEGGTGTVTTASVVGGTITVTLLVVKGTREEVAGRRVVTGGIRRRLNVRVMVLM